MSIARSASSSSGRSTPSATTRAPTSRANAAVARSTASRVASPSTPATIVARQLEEVRPDLGHVLQRREAGAGVVDRDQRAARDPRPQPLAQQRVVEHGVLLGELDHEPLRQPAGDLEQARVAERLRRQVDPQQAAVRRHAGGGDRRPARDLELVAQPDAAGGGEHHVRRQRHQARRRGEARQALVADRAQIRQAHDRLEDGANRPGLPAGRESRQPRPIVPVRSARAPGLERSGILLDVRRLGGRDAQPAGRRRAGASGRRP